MVKLHGQLPGNLYDLLKPTVDVYYHPKLGILARSWPRDNAPARTPGWKATQANLQKAWEIIKSVPEGFIDEFKTVSRSNSTRTVYDQIRSSVMTAQDGQYYVSVIEESSAYYDDEEGELVLTVTYDSSYLKGNPDFPKHPDILVSNQESDLTPRWLQYPTPTPSLCKSQGKHYPVWPKKPSRVHPQTHYDPVQVSPDTVEYHIPTPRKGAFYGKFVPVQTGKNGGPRLLSGIMPIDR